MNSHTETATDVSRLAKDELVKLISSEQGPWSNRSIELQDRTTLERLARIARRARAVRSGV